MMEHRSKAYTREEFNKVLREFHKQSSRHVLIVEADISHVNKCAIFHEKLKKIIELTMHL